MKYISAITIAFAALLWGCTTEVIIEPTDPPREDIEPTDPPREEGRTIDDAFRIAFIEGYVDGDESFRGEAECVYDLMVDWYPGGESALVDEVLDRDDSDQLAEDVIGGVIADRWSDYKECIE